MTRQELDRALSEIANAMKQIVRSSRLPRVEQDDFLRALASIKIVVKDAANHLATQPAQGRNGADEPEPKKKAGEKTKRKAAAGD